MREIGRARMAYTMQMSIIEEWRIRDRLAGPGPDLAYLFSLGSAAHSPAAWEQIEEPQDLCRKLSGSRRGAIQLLFELVEEVALARYRVIGVARD